MNIPYAKIKKNSRRRFLKPQPARASLNSNTIVIITRKIHPFQNSTIEDGGKRGENEFGTNISLYTVFK